MGAISFSPEYGMGMMALLTNNHATGSAATIATHHSHGKELVESDACLCCSDTREDITSGVKAMHESSRGPETSWFMSALSSFCPTLDKEKTYTMCQIRKHNHANSAWILVGDTIYDATPYIRNHPGGMAAILRKSGGAVDCTEDLSFHSKRAQKEWKRFKVGTLRPCPHDCRR
mmetsp:Transcript_14369/g.30737  ORF Transcript_14369/g.30737 Transcript_14369/m.30737 type:complete len:174 (-) Transcript_14369:215-736(-)